MRLKATTALKTRQKLIAPKHIAIIMDGNRRWAKKRGLPKLFGHRKGYEALFNLADACLERGVETITVFAFSTENWKRSKDEVDYLFALFRDIMNKDLGRLIDKKVKLNVIGRLDELPKDLRADIKEAMKKTEKFKKYTLNVAINYGGRAEIVDAVKSLIKEGKKAEDISEAEIARHMYTRGQNDPDMVIRTSGEERTSGFLTWQSVYSELYFTETLWPDFGEKQLDKAISEYSSRQRRFGV